MSDFVLCCDWGTSNLRLRLIQREPFRVLTQVADDQGIGQAHRLWEAQAHGIGTDPRQRTAFFEKFLRQSVRRLQVITGLNLEELPIVVSGMASSSLGLKELPYANLPFPLSGDDAVCEWLPRNPSFSHDILLISGLKSAADIMRGEETQLIGLGTLDDAYVTDGLFVLPGTHSKHVRVKEGEIVGFETFMTGELFQALSEHTVLQESIRRTQQTTGAQVQAFRRGVEVAKRGSLVRDLFSVRCKDLLFESSKEENYHYLSGMLIGHELRPLAADDCRTIVLACNDTLLPAYKEAAAYLGLSSRTRILPPETVDEAAPRGQIRLYQAVLNRRTAAV